MAGQNWGTYGRGSFINTEGVELAYETMMKDLMVDELSKDYEMWGSFETTVSDVETVPVSIPPNASHEYLHVKLADHDGRPLTFYFQCDKKSQEAFELNGSSSNTDLYIPKDERIEKGTSIKVYYLRYFIKKRFHDPWFAYLTPKTKTVFTPVRAFIKGEERELKGALDAGEVTHVFLTSDQSEYATIVPDIVLLNAEKRRKQTEHIKEEPIFLTNI